MIDKIKEYDKLAIIGLILCLLGPLAILGIGISIYTLKKSDKYKKSQGLAIVGLIIGTIILAATIFIFIKIWINSPPVAKDDYFVTKEDEKGTMNVTSNDFDEEDNRPKLDSITNMPKHGDIRIESSIYSDNPDKKIVYYSPDKNYNGEDNFTYRIKDSRGAKDTANVKIMIKSVNDAPKITSFSPNTSPTIRESETKEFEIEYSDVDNTSNQITVKWYLDGSKVSSGKSYTYSPSFDPKEKYTVKAEVSDGIKTVSHKWNLNIITLYNEDGMNLLPKDDEIDTEWSIDKREGIDITERGFDSGAHLEITKIEYMTATTGNVKVYKFNSINDADNYYKKRVDEIRRPYEEKSLYFVGSECFAIEKTYGDYGLEKETRAICKKKNVVYITSTFGSNYFRYYDNLARMVDQKIS